MRDFLKNKPAEYAHEASKLTKKLKTSKKFISDFNVSLTNTNTIASIKPHLVFQ